MRAWLASWGIKFRRFPVWLHIFNVLCAAALTALGLAGLYFLRPVSPSRPIIAEGRLDGGALIAALERGERAQARDKILALAPAARDEVFRDIAALCDAGAAALCFDLLDAVSAKAGLEARRRWTRVLGGGVADWGPARLKSALGEREADAVRAAALRESLLYGGALARRAATAELVRRRRPGDQAFLAAARRLPAELALGPASEAPSISLKAEDEARILTGLRSAEPRRALEALLVGDLPPESRRLDALRAAAAEAVKGLPDERRAALKRRARGSFWRAMW